MCSDANPTEVALQKAQADFTNTLDASFKTTFANQQQILGQLSTTLQKAIANPQGYTPAQMAALRTGAIDATSQATNDAEKAAAAYGASHGGADLGSGVQSQIQGTIASGGAQQLAQANEQITEANANLQQQNYWNAISGLTNVGRSYDPTGYANAATNSANAVTNASNAITSEQQAGWQNAFGIVSGISGLASAAAGLPFGGGGGATPFAGVSGPFDPSGPVPITTSSTPNSI